MTDRSPTPLPPPPPLLVAPAPLPGLPTNLPARHRARLTRAAALFALAAPVFWAAILGLELRQAGVSHSLVSRPERIFGPGPGPLPLYAWLALLLIPSAIFARRLEHRRVAAAAFAVAAIALLARAVVAAASTDPNLYQVSQLRGLAAEALLLCLPAALMLFALAAGRRAATMRWLSAAASVAMIWAAVWTVQWSVRSGALQPQLWAVEPVEGVFAGWTVAMGAWLLGRPRRLDHVRLPRPAIPSPGAKAALALAVVAIAGVVVSSAGYVAAVGPTIAAQLTGRTQVATIRVGGFDRTYRVHRPSQLAGAPGLVIVLHAVFGSGYLAESSTGFDAQADRLGWVVAYPDGVLDGWDAFGDTPYWGRHPGVDDVAFAGALIDRLSAENGLDPDRIYVTGFSRGAMMAYRLGCELSGRVAAIAPVSGNMATASGSADVPCRTTKPVSVLAIHGTSDGSIPISGGHVDIDYSPFWDVISRWRAWDSCAGTGAISVDGRSTTTSWTCTGGSTVAARVVDGGVHAWPGAVAPPYSTAAPADAFDAARVIADFFVAHPRARAATAG